MQGLLARRDRDLIRVRPGTRIQGSASARRFKGAIHSVSGILPSARTRLEPCSAAQGPGTQPADPVVFSGLGTNDRNPPSGVTSKETIIRSGVARCRLTERAGQGAWVGVCHSNPLSEWLSNGSPCSRYSPASFSSCAGRRGSACSSFERAARPRHTSFIRGMAASRANWAWLTST